MYVLTLTDEQASVIGLACELFSRLHMGQVNDLLYEAAMYHRTFEKLHALRPQVDEIVQAVFGLQGTAQHSITSPAIPDAVRIAYDAYQALRYARSCAEYPDGPPPGLRGTLAFCEPMVTSLTQRLPKVEIVAAEMIGGGGHDA